jgi:hypothetical protein
MINRFDHRAKTYEGYKGNNKYGRKPGLPSVTDEQHSQAAFEVEPRYWMFSEIAKNRLQAKIGDRAMIAYREIGASWTNRRSVKAALLFPTPATHKLPMLTVLRGLALSATALFNSLIFDFLARIHMPGGSLTPWIVSQCPAPTPAELDPKCSKLAARLTATSQKLADAYGLDLHSWDSQVRPRLEAECDARVARSYGLTRNQYERLFDHFEVMARAERAAYGEERTQRLCLEAFDRISKET